jgi:hypothetical protein
MSRFDSPFDARGKQAPTPAPATFYSPWDAVAPGPEGSVYFLDSSPSQHVVTVVGNTHQTGTDGKAGFLFSGIFDGTGDQLSLPDSDDWFWGTADHTQECWVNPRVVLGVAQVMLQQDDGVNFNKTQLSIGPSNEPKMAFREGGVLNFSIGGAVACPSGQWTFIRGERFGDVWFLWKGNQIVASVYDNAAVPDLSGGMKVGAAYTDQSNPFDGKLDEVRISKGIARGFPNIKPTWLDSSGFARSDISAHGGAVRSPVTPKFDVASLQLPGTGWVGLPAAVTPDGSADFTIDQWFSLAATGGGVNNAIWSAGDPGGDHICLFLGTLDFPSLQWYEGGVLKVNLDAGGLEVITDTDLHHFAVTFDSGTDTWTLFLDGVPIDSAVYAPTTWASPESISLGSFFPGWGGGNSATGNMDEFRISNNVRWTAAFDTSDELFTDSSTGGGTSPQTVTSVNGAKQEAGGWSASGNQALVLDGVDQYLTVTDTADFPDGNAAWTAEGWGKADTTGSFDAIVGHGTDATNLWLLYKNSSDKFIFFWQIGGVNEIAIISSTTFADTEEHHVAITFDGASTWTLWVDGVSEGTDTSAFTPTNFTGAAVVGSDQLYSGGAPWAGRLDQIRISTVARYSTTFIPSRDHTDDANTVLLLKFEDGAYVSDANTLLLMHFDQLASQIDDTTNHTVNKHGVTYATYEGRLRRLGYPATAPISSAASTPDSTDFDFGSDPFQWKCRINHKGATLVDRFGRVINHSMADGTFLQDEAYIQVGTDGKVSFQLRVAGVQQVLLLSTTLVAQDVPMLIEVARSGSSWTMDINGAQEGSDTYAGAVPAVIDGALQFGGGRVFPAVGINEIWDIEIIKDGGTVFQVVSFTEDTLAAPTNPYTPDDYDKLLLHMDG